jgi:predicted porin
MQKKLLGMAVATALAAPAVALAQVQVYGTANVSFNSTKYGESASGVAGVSKMTVASHASNFGIRSSETLGGGLTGWVQYEFNVKMERDNDLAAGNGSSRNTAVGIRGGFGNVYFGTWETPFASTFRMWDVGTIGGWGASTSVMYRRESTTSSPSNNCANPPSGQAIFTGGALPAAFCYHADGGPNGAYALWRRYGSAVFYDSPMFSGFQFKIGYQPNETKSVAGVTLAVQTTPTATTTTTVAENPSSWSASLSWTGMGGNARAFIANMQAKDWTSIGQTDGGFIVGGGYDFGVANVGAAYETYKYKAAASDTKTKEYAVAVAIPMGSGKIGASYVIAKDPVNSVTGAVDAGAKMYNVGYEWALSKRTAVGFGYAAIKNDPGAVFTWTGMAPIQNGVTLTPLAGSDPSNIFVAFRHSF